jgi:pimeloyl-ACP methyl ester carboxylesterase
VEFEGDGRPQPRLKIIPGAGHSEQVENPEETAKSMMDFLAK